MSTYGRAHWLRAISLAALIAATPALALAQTDPNAPTPANKAPAKAPKDDGKKPAAGKAKGDKDKSTQVEGVTITAGPDPVRQAIDRRSYDMSKDLQAQNGASVADALRNVPSVDVDLDGKVSLRGQSGVTIMVDGKPAPLYAGPGGGQALLQVPAGQYDRVEVMTNPSAAFSPDGSAGIINLVTKKNHPMGSFGSVRASVADADHYRGGGGGSIHNGKLTVVLQAGAGNSRDPQSANAVTQSFTPAGALQSTNASHSAGVDANSYQYGFGSLSYQARPDTTLSFTGHGFHFEGKQNTVGDTALTDGSGALVENLSESVRNLASGGGGMGELKLRRDFAGDDHNLTLSLSGNHFEFTDKELAGDQLITPPTAETFLRSDQRSVSDTTRFAGDYVRPTPNGGQLKAGWDIAENNDTTDSDGVLSAPSPTSPDDPTQTDHYRFKRTVSAGYVTFQHPIGKLTVLGGLRVENENLDINDATTVTEVKRNDTHLYPTLHLSYALDENQSLSASYSERIQRPDGRSFDPFVRVTGPFSESAGNPFLKPQQTQDFETSWQTHAGGGFYVATLYYKLNTGGVTQVTTDTGGVLLTTQENLTRSKNAGLELVASGKLPYGFSYNLSGNVYWNQIDGVAAGFSETRSSTVLAGRATINWQATPKDYFQFHISEAGKQLTPQGFTEIGPQADLGYRHKLTDKLNLVVSAQNVFDTSYFKSTFDSQTLRGHSENDQHNRTVYFGLVYNFGASPRGRQDDFDFGQGAPGASPH